MSDQAQKAVVKCARLQIDVKRRVWVLFDMKNLIRGARYESKATLIDRWLAEHGKIHVISTYEGNMSMAELACMVGAFRDPKTGGA